MVRIKPTIESVKATINQAIGRWFNSVDIRRNAEKLQHIGSLGSMAAIVESSTSFIYQEIIIASLKEKDEDKLNFVTNKLIDLEDTLAPIAQSYIELLQFYAGLIVAGEVVDINSLSKKLKEKSA